MQQAREKLEKFRKEKAASAPSNPIPDPSPSETPVPTSAPKAKAVPAQRSLLGRLLNFDLLGTAPFRIYYHQLDTKPYPTIMATLATFGAGFVIAVQNGFGMVFVIFALLMAILLSLGKKQDGEVSAYSVFNENCERLLGQMTPEHFERDVLRRRAV